MKKIIAVIFGLFSMGLSIFGCTEKKKSDTWFIATGEDSGFPLIIRARSALPSGIETQEYPSLVTIIWKYSPIENGMPGDNERNEMDSLEAEAESRLEIPGHGFMTAIITCNGRREWQWYAKDRNQFLQLLNEYLSGKPKYPIEISEQPDPNWEEWKGMVRQAKAKQ